MIIDGRAFANEILAEVKGSISHTAHVRAITVAPTAATLSFLRAKKSAAEKAGMTLEIIQLADDALVDAVVEAVQAPGADAVIVQLPLPEDLDEDYILARIPLSKDADVLSPLAQEESTMIPPVAGAVREILLRAHVEIKGAKCVVVGQGRLVGAPVATWLKKEGAEVLTINDETFDIPESKATLLAADIVVSGAGVPHLIKPDMVKEGVVLIDAGTSEQGGAVVGDIDPSCAARASVFTPVPGGVGPITVACLFRNIAHLVSFD